MKILISFLVYLILLSGCIQSVETNSSNKGTDIVKTDETIVNDSVQHDINYEISDNRFILKMSKGLSIDDLDMNYNFKSGELYRYLPFLLNLEIESDIVDSELELFEDFELTIMVKEDRRKTVVLNFHDGHYVTVDDTTLSISKLPYLEEVIQDVPPFFLKGSEMLGLFFLPVDIKDIKFEIWNMPIFHHEVRVKLKNHMIEEDIIQSLKNTVFDIAYAVESSNNAENWFLESSPYSDFKMNVETSSSVYQYIEAYDGIMKFGKLEYHSENSFISGKLVPLFKNVLPHNHDCNVYLKPIYFENDDLVMVSEPTSLDENTNEVTHQDLISWLEQGLQLVDGYNMPSSGCVFLHDRLENTYELCKN